jgi:hypothetical protein
MPRVINMHKEGTPEGSVFCGRGSPYGNPYVMKSKSDAERNYVCDAFEKYILPNLDVSALRGKDLVCFCAPKRCHCDAILRKANA